MWKLLHPFSSLEMLRVSSLFSVYDTTTNICSFDMLKIKHLQARNEVEKGKQKRGKSYFFSVFLECVFTLSTKLFVLLRKKKYLCNSKFVINPFQVLKFCKD